LSLKIALNIDYSEGTGPSTFATRLGSALENRGHSLVDPGDKPDVDLVFIQPSRPYAPGAAVIQRLDGIWFKPEEINVRNAEIRRCYHEAKAVIWQSEFDKQMALRWLGVPQFGRVIHNGVSLEPVKELTIEPLIRMRNTYEKIFVCSSNWHAQKRLKSNIELYMHARELFYKNSCLIVLGSSPDHFIADPHIFYAGWQRPEVTREIYAASNWMLHLAWLDHCPNVVCEALAQATRVIHASSGGTRELVIDDGTMLHETDEYNFQPADYDNPPVINVKQVVEPFIESAFVPRTELSIEHVAEQYERLMLSVVGGET
jgi:glycosyltransferase involved in cell wall biosynthesis